MCTLRNTHYTPAPTAPLGGTLGHPVHTQSSLSIHNFSYTVYAGNISSRWWLWSVVRVSVWCLWCGAGKMSQVKIMRTFARASVLLHIVGTARKKARARPNTLHDKPTQLFDMRAHADE